MTPTEALKMKEEELQIRDQIQSLEGIKSFLSKNPSLPDREKQLQELEDSLNELKALLEALPSEA